MKSRTIKWLRIVIPGAMLLQLSTCLGTDPNFFFAQTAVSSLVNNLVSTIFQVLTSALTV